MPQQPVSSTCRRDPTSRRSRRALVSGGSGAIGAAVTALSIAHDAVHGNLTDDPIENLNLPLFSLKTTIRRALTVSYGFGGHNAALLLGKVNGHG